MAKRDSVVAEAARRAHPDLQRGEERVRSALRQPAFRGLSGRVVLLRRRHRTKGCLISNSKLLWPPSAAAPALSLRMMSIASATHRAEVEVDFSLQVCCGES